MSDKIVLYTNPLSRGRIARWMLEEIGESYETKVVDYGPMMKSPEYLAINPMGKVPAIVHGGAVVTECAAICAYLADIFPAAGLAPPPDDRGAYYRWLFFAAGPLEQATADRMLEVQPSAEQQRMLGYGNYDTTLDALEQAVSRTAFVAGEKFTAADVYLGAHMGWGLQYGHIERRPAFEAYWRRVSDRDGYRRADELDNSLAAQVPTAE